MTDNEIKQQVRNFYDQVGWQLTPDAVYQNARYEDLRPVSREYIHRCHMRVKQHLPSSGKYLLDAGSGPIQYPEYLTYSQGFQYRVCLDISIQALMEARKRIGDHGLFVVGDVSNLPFKKNVFGGMVSLHTLHHLPAEDQKKAYFDLYRVLSPNSSGVVVNGWTDSGFMRSTQWLVNVMEKIGKTWISLRGKNRDSHHSKDQKQSKKSKDPQGTFIVKINPNWLEDELSGNIPLRIKVWRSVNVRFLRAIIHRQLAGKLLLRVLFRLEEWFPGFFGKHGQYPLIIIEKPRLNG